MEMVVARGMLATIIERHYFPFTQRLKDQVGE